MEPFAAIVIAHGTHVFGGGGLLRPEGPKLKAKGREQGRGSWSGATSPSSPARGQQGERYKLPQRVSGQSPDCKYILDLLRAQKMRLVAANVGCSLIFLSTGSPAEPLDTTGRFRGIPVEKQCCTKPMPVMFYYKAEGCW